MNLSISILEQDPNTYQVGGNHYKDAASNGYQHWDLMWDLYGASYFIAGASKYVSRFKGKNGKQDLEKAKQYIHKLIYFLRQDENYRDDSSSHPLLREHIHVHNTYRHVECCVASFIDGLSTKTSLMKDILLRLFTRESVSEFIVTYGLVDQLILQTYPDKLDEDAAEPSKHYVSQEGDHSISSTLQKLNNLTTVKFFPKHPRVKLPEYAKHGDAGMDVCAHLEEHTSDFPDRKALTIAAGERRLINTGLHVAVPHGYMIQVCSRSGLAAKNGVITLISPGIIDSGYRGELKVCLFNASNDRFIVEDGDRVAQLIVQHVPYLTISKVDSIEDLGETSRGHGGFGSTGTN